MTFIDSLQKLNRIVPAVLIAVSVSCSKEAAELPADGRNEIKFVVDETKSTDTSFENGDAVSLFAAAPVNAANVKLIYSNGSLIPQTKLRWAEGQTVATTFDAIYPYSADYSSATLSTFTVRSDQSSKAAFNASDLMTAQASSSPADGAVRLSFSHKLAKFEISLGNEVRGTTVTSVSISGVKLSYDLAGATATGSQGTVTAYPVNSGSRYAVILAPQTVTPVINVSLSNGKTYTFSDETPITLATGLRNSTSITVKPDGSDDDDPSTTRSWFEMPSIIDKDNNGIDDNDPNLYYAYHKFSMNGKSMRNYSICYSADHHGAMWVAAPMHSCYTGSTGRTNSYGKDPDIPSAIQFSSKDTGGGCNKGHLLSSRDRTCCTEANNQVFYYTNISPQDTRYNTGGGGWNVLEDYVEQFVCSDTLYTVIGCYYESYKDGYGYSASPGTISFGGRNDVDVPTMFYYALLRTKSGKSGKKLSQCSASELKCVAFVRSHNTSLSGVKPSSKEMMSVADLEKITGFKYFVNVPNAPKDSFNPNEW